jgi:hypothetical protein
MTPAQSVPHNHTTHVPTHSERRRAILTAASFLLSNDNDRDELVARLAGRSHMFIPNSEVTTHCPYAVHGPSSQHAASSSTPSAPFLLSHPIQTRETEMRREDESLSIQSVASFLLRNDSDREELVNVLRRAAFQPQPVGFDAEAAVDKAASTALTVENQSNVGVYGLRDSDIFNQLVMLEVIYIYFRCHCYSDLFHLSPMLLFPPLFFSLFFYATLCLVL